MSEVGSDCSEVEFLDDRRHECFDSVPEKVLFVDPEEFLGRSFDLGDNPFSVGGADEEHAGGGAEDDVFESEVLRADGFFVDFLEESVLSELDGLPVDLDDEVEVVVILVF